jgi:flagellin
MTSIASNVIAQRVLYHSNRNEIAYNTASERLSSGKQLNKASDDPAGAFVAQRLKVAVLGMGRAIDNSNDGVSLLQTAEANLNEIRNITIRLRELAVQMANGVYQDTPDRGHSEEEVNQLLAQIDMIADNANFNGVKLLDGSFQNVGIHSGANVDERISISLANNTVTGLRLNGLSLTTQQNARDAMTSLDSVLENISTDLSLIGSYQNRLTHNISLMSNTQRHSQIAFGRIVDADIADESIELSKAQVLAQTNTAMLAQANASLHSVLDLFR